MATFLLQAAGAAIGTAIGGPFGGIVGRVAGAVAGSLIDTALLGGSSSAKPIEGPRLSDLNGISSTEGSPIPRVYGRSRLGGQVIWATQFEEVVTTSRVSSGGGGGKGSGSKSTTQTTYSYFANVAIALCEGPIAFVRRVWADGDLLDLNAVVMRVYIGTEGQPPDPLIVAKEGDAFAPAYRGTAYVVFERLPLADYGNRLPQLTFEVVAPVAGLPNQIRAVNLIPGSGEFVYDTVPVSRDFGFGSTASENRHQFNTLVDWNASIDQLRALCPNVASVSLVVGWFGDDLRAGSCTVAPRIDLANKETIGDTWLVSGIARPSARLVTQVNGRPAYGGTPADTSVIAAIQDLRSRGLETVLYPFVMMDVPAGNGLPDPATGASSQPAYPWRGRITCFPGPGQPGSPDGTSTAAAQVNTFFGSAAAGDFVNIGGTIAYTGPDEWSFRRLILHYAHLAVAAGGVNAFIIGSELIGLTRVQSAAGVYPAVAALQALAADVRSILGSGTRITYAADWTEYGAHVTASGDVHFPLDPLWASSAIDMIGIDWYVPLSDWRDGTEHADAAIALGPVDLDYLTSRVGSGEAFDFYYPDDAARAAQNREPITDGLGKPWVFRQKDLANWWLNPHFPRSGGFESTSSTAWSPGSKPIWLTEMGCPAVDRGANAPNIFPDPKSQAPQLPYFSRGSRDDLVLYRAVSATLRFFDPALPGHPAGANPVSGTTGIRMVDPAHVVIWTWDARPFPAFPYLTDVWADGDNWSNGHWLNGRLEGVPLDLLVKVLARDLGGIDVDTTALVGYVDGYVVDRTMSARNAIEPLATLFGFDALEREGVLTFIMRDRPAVLTLGDDDLVPDRDGQSLNLVRQQESELPRAISFTFVDAENDYRSAAVTSRRIEGVSRRESKNEVATRRAVVQRQSDILLQETWIGRETLSATLRPGLVNIEIGDTVGVEIAGNTRLFHLTRITDGAGRRIEASASEPTVHDVAAGPSSLASISMPAIAGPPQAVVLDLPAATADLPPLQYLAVAADPWPGGFILWRSIDGESFQAVTTIEAAALIGETTTVLPPGPLWHFDRSTTLGVRLSGEGLASIDPLRMLAGDNMLAVCGADGQWELLGFADAILTGQRQYTLSTLLRGLGASEALAARTLPAGSPVVFVDRTLTSLTTNIDDLFRTYQYRLSPVGSDLGSPTAVGFSAAASPLVLKPFAPVGATAKRAGGGITLSWTRRTRRGGDSWDLVEVPLAEEREAYEVDILSGTSVVRTLSIAAPTAVYADEVADFGAAQTSLSLRICQLSATVGRGLPLVATIPVF